MRVQTLTRDTIVGTRWDLAPAGWKFDKTAVIVWAKLLEKAREPTKTRCDVDQMHALANVLSNALGMAPPYWEEAAYMIAKEEDDA